MLGLVSILLTLAQVGNGDWDNGHHDWDDGWGIVMGIIMLLFLALLIFGLIWAIREIGAHRHAGARPAADDPLAILDRRLAEGTISPEEYRERRAILSDKPDR